MLLFFLHLLIQLTLSIMKKKYTLIAIIFIIFFSSCVTNKKKRCADCPKWSYSINEFTKAIQ